MTYIVQFDKHFQDGLFAGITASGETITYPTELTAMAAYQHYFHRAVVSVMTDYTGNRYTVSRVRLYKDGKDITPTQTKAKE